MIAEAEIRRLAAVAGVDPMVQDLDYALGWFLASLLRQPDVAEAMLFKGGTCLRKCYFADYRFSEDIDFTEMMAEKIRALSGQRRFAVSRDLYDIYQLSQQGIDVAGVRAALPAKFAAKGMDIRDLSFETLLECRVAMQTDWDRRLVHLFPAGQLIDFEVAWQIATHFVRTVME